MRVFLSSALTIFIFIFFSYIWQFINLPFSNPNEVVGILAEKKINPLNDTVRFIALFTGTVGFFFFIRLYQEKNLFNIDFLFNKSKFSNLSSIKINDIKFVLAFLFIYLAIDFFSYNPNYFFYDPLHDGDNLTPAQNFEISKKIWSSSYAIHGASNSLYGFLGWQIFDVKSIGSLRYFYVLLLFFLKILTVIFSFQILKLINLEKKNKKIIFLILSIIFINFVNYQTPINYSILSFRDIFLVLYLIFLIQLFSQQKLNKNIIFILSIISNIALIFHYDIGTYLQITNIFLIIYFFVSKKFNLIFFFLVSYLVCWTILLIIFGFKELNLFLEHYSIIVKNIDFIHGLSFPHPVFDLGNNQHAARATRALFLLVAATCLVIEIVIFQKKKLSNNQKILFIFFIILGVLSFKNALGRSDSYHIRMSTEIPLIIILTLFFSNIINSNLLLKLNGNFKNIILIIFLSSAIFFKFDYINIINFNKNVKSFILAKDNKYLDKDTLIFYNDAKNILYQEECIFNFTMDLGLPYLLRKKTCSRYFQTYIFSGKDNEKKYISDLKNINHKYIIYESPKFVVDNIKIVDRLKFVNKFIKDNYNPYYEKNGFKIYVKK
tara:strand:+ start:849 stop:2666 length:1818 start_codon:yes stop_codon:yes gene_type:complete